MSCGLKSRPVNVPTAPTHSEAGRQRAGALSSRHGRALGPRGTRGLDHHKLGQVFRGDVADEALLAIDDADHAWSPPLQELEYVIETGILRHGRHVARHEVEHWGAAAFFL